jgi:hypothetical protein
MKNNLRLLFILLFIGAALPGGNLKRELEPYTCFFDFASGSVGAWASYPPAQDTAYDPTIWVKSIGENRTRALVREITPNYEIDYTFGMRKKLNIYVDKNSLLSFRYYVKNHRIVEGIIVKFGFEDGSSKEVTVPVNKKLSWEDAQVRFRDICGDKEIKRLKAVAFMAVCPKADPEAMLKFAIDNVKIEGYREKKFRVKDPDVYWLEEFYVNIAKKHYSKGEDIEIRGEFPLKVKKAAVKVRRALNGEDEIIFRLDKKRDGKWVAPIDSDKLGSGIWKADIEGVGDEGESVKTSMVFLIKPKNAPEHHPCLLISSQDKTRIMEGIKTGYLKKIWENIQKTAGDMRKTYTPDDFNYNLDAYDEKYWLPTYGGYAGTIRTLASFSRYNGLVYFLSGDREAGEAAKKTLLKMAEWPTYVHPHILNQGQFTYWPVGLMLTDLALGYDTIYDLLTPKERKKVADALYHKGVTEVFKEYVRDNRVSSDTSNWTSHVTGGGILSALVISEEYTDKELEPYLTGMILKVGELVKNTFDRDGNYGEGYGYHNFTMQTLAEIMCALERNFGIHFPGKVNNSFEYLLYQMDPFTKELYDFGDTGNRLLPMSNFVYLLNKTKDPLLKWLYDLSPGYHDIDLFFYDEKAKPINPSDLPTVKWFKDVGTVVFRSGFEHDDFLFVFRCGPFYNHQHFDQGSFFLSDRGEDLITEGGKTDYYHDPWYQKFFIQPGAHNCILVDENVESQRPGDIKEDVQAWKEYAEITDFMEFGGGAFTSGDLTRIYKGKFKGLTRSILYLKPRTVVVIDQGEGAGGAERMNLRFHPPLKKDIQLNGKTAKINRPAASLFLKTLAPEQYKSEVLKRPLSLSEYGKENPITMSARGFLQFTSELKPGGTTFINVLTSDRSVISNLNEKKSTAYTRLTIADREFFVNTKVNELYQADGFETDALIYSSGDDGFFAFRVTKLTADGRTIFASPSPVSIVLTKGNVTAIEYSAYNNTRISYFFPEKPRKITLNGDPIQNWDYRGRIVILNIAKGNGIIEIL